MEEEAEEGEEEGEEEHEEEEEEEKEEEVEEDATEDEGKEEEVEDEDGGGGDGGTDVTWSAAVSFPVEAPLPCNASSMNSNASLKYGIISCVRSSSSFRCLNAVSRCSVPGVGSMPMAQDKTCVM